MVVGWANKLHIMEYCFVCKTKDRNSLQNYYPYSILPFQLCMIERTHLARGGEQICPLRFVSWPPCPADCSWPPWDTPRTPAEAARRASHRRPRPVQWPGRWTRTGRQTRPEDHRTGETPPSIPRPPGAGLAGVRKSRETRRIGSRTTLARWRWLPSRCLDRPRPPRRYTAAPNDTGHLRRPWCSYSATHDDLLYKSPAPG